MRAIGRVLCGVGPGRRRRRTPSGYATTITACESAMLGDGVEMVWGFRGDSMSAAGVAARQSTPASIRLIRRIRLIRSSLVIGGRERVRARTGVHDKTSP